MGEFLIALDQGTSSSRCIVFDKFGSLHFMEQSEISSSYPKEGWVEQDPLELWEKQKHCLELVTRKINAHSPDEGIACGLTNQRETIILWNKDTSEPVYPAIVWQDCRTSDYCLELKQKGLSKWVQKKTGLPIDPYFSATKIRWILKNIKTCKKLLKEGKLLCGTVDSWLIWKFTNGAYHVTDPSNASRTLLFNLETQEWDHELLELFEIPSTILPIITNSDCQIPLKDYPFDLFAILGDQQASLFGNQCFSKYDTKCTFGTGCFQLMNNGDEIIQSQHGLLNTVAWKIENKINYALEGAIFSGGSTIKWLRDEMHFFDKTKECEGLAKKVKDSEGCILIPAFNGLGAPYWDPNARGLIHGLTTGTNSAHITRAALWSISLQVYDLIKTFEKEVGKNIGNFKVDGGASKNKLLMEFQASLLNIPIQVAQHTELTGWGVASLAGFKRGLFKSLDEIKSIDLGYRDLRSFENKEVQKMKLLWKKAIPKALKWLPFESAHE